MDPRTPVLVGAAQLNARDGDSEPIDLMSRAAGAALADTGSESLARGVQSVRVIKGIWPYQDPGTLVADRLGLAGVRTGLTPIGGNEAYDLFNATAAQVQAGDVDAVVICSSETMRTRRRDFAAGRKSAYLTEREGASADQSFGQDKSWNEPNEKAIGTDRPANFYAMAESAIRHRNGETPDQHLGRISALWATGSAVASRNPNAWLSEFQSAEAIARAGPKNRMVAAPYRKLMTSNINVDMGAAVVLCSAAAAEAQGVPRDRWVFPHAGSGAADPWITRQRLALDESPAMRVAGKRVLALAETGVDDIEFLDLYSCFPAAVQLAQRELGISADRDFTITGGLTFNGGPMNTYCLHPLAQAVGLLRENTGTRALLTGNGGYFTKHAFCVLGSEPSRNTFRTERTQDEVESMGLLDLPSELPEAGVLEAYTVIHDRVGQPENAILSVLDRDGLRTWANSSDTGTMAELLSKDCCSRAVRVSGTVDAPVASLA